MYEQRIKELEQEHAELKALLVKAEAEHWNDVEIQEIKKKKLLVKDIIRELTNLDNAGREFK